mgnify:CR=1 FL=1
MSTVYGCHNREPLKTEAVVQTGWSTFIQPDAEARMVARIPDPMSKDCRYTHTDLGQADAKCEGCKHRAGRMPATF